MLLRGQVVESSASPNASDGVALEESGGGGGDNGMEPSSSGAGDGGGGAITHGEQSATTWQVGELKGDEVLISDEAKCKGTAYAKTRAAILFLPKQTLDLLVEADPGLGDAVKRRVGAVKSQRSTARLQKLWPFSGTALEDLAPLVSNLRLRSYEEGETIVEPDLLLVVAGSLHVNTRMSDGRVLSTSVGVGSEVGVEQLIEPGESGDAVRSITGETLSATTEEFTVTLELSASAVHALCVANPAVRKNLQANIAMVYQATRPESLRKHWPLVMLDDESSMTALARCLSVRAEAQGSFVYTRGNSTSEALVLLRGSAISTFDLPAQQQQQSTVGGDGSGDGGGGNGKGGGEGGDDKGDEGPREHFVRSDAGAMVAADALLAEPSALLASVEITSPSLVLSIRGEDYRKLLLQRKKLAAFKRLEEARGKARDLGAEGHGFTLPSQPDPATGLILACEAATCCLPKDVDLFKELDDAKGTRIFVLLDGSVETSAGSGGGGGSGRSTRSNATVAPTSDVLAGQRFCRSGGHAAKLAGHESASPHKDGARSGALWLSSATVASAWCVVLAVPLDVISDAAAEERAAQEAEVRAAKAERAAMRQVLRTLHASVRALGVRLGQCVPFEPRSMWRKALYRWRMLHRMGLDVGVGEPPLQFTSVAEELAVVQKELVEAEEEVRKRERDLVRIISEAVALRPGCLPDEDSPSPDLDGTSLHDVSLRRLAAAKAEVGAIHARRLQRHTTQLELCEKIWKRTFAPDAIRRSTRAALALPRGLQPERLAVLAGELKRQHKLLAPQLNSAIEELKAAFKLLGAKGASIEETIRELEKAKAEPVEGLLEAVEAQVAVLLRAARLARNMLPHDKQRELPVLEAQVEVRMSRRSLAKDERDAINDPMGGTTVRPWEVLDAMLLDAQANGDDFDYEFEMLRKEKRLELETTAAMLQRVEGKEYHAAVTIQRIAHGVAWRRHSTGPEGRVAKYDAMVAQGAPTHKAAAEAAMSEVRKLWEGFSEPQTNRGAFEGRVKALPPVLQAEVTHAEAAQLRSSLLTNQLFVLLPRWAMARKLMPLKLMHAEVAVTVTPTELAAEQKQKAEAAASKGGDKKKKRAPVRKKEVTSAKIRAFLEANGISHTRSSLAYFLGELGLSISDLGGGSDVTVPVLTWERAFQAHGPCWSTSSTTPTAGADSEDGFGGKGGLGERSRRTPGKWLVAEATDVAAEVDGPQIAAVVRQDAMEFDDVDRDQDNKLDFGEFCALVRKREVGSHSESELRERFEKLDADGSGKVDMNEYIVFVLRDALSRSSQRVIELFVKWDEDASGEIDKREFRRLVGSMGFSMIGDASEIDLVFDSFDADGSGKLAYAELNQALRDGPDGRKVEHKPKVRRQLRSLEERAMDAVHQDVLPPPIEPVNPELNVSMEDQLVNALKRHAVRVIDIFRAWDEDNDGLVSKKEFRKAIHVIGLDVPREDIDAVFDRFDVDGSGCLSYAELKNALRKRPAVSSKKLISLFG